MDREGGGESSYNPPPSIRKFAKHRVCILQHKCRQNLPLQKSQKLTSAINLRAHWERRRESEREEYRGKEERKRW